MTLTHLLDHVPVGEDAKWAIIYRLKENHRRYHNLDHVVEMWHWHCAHDHALGYNESTINEIVASYCLYHDAVYDPVSKDNEWQSALLWRCDSIRASQPVRLLTNDAILASMDHFAEHEHEPVIRWCLNLDLLRLGTSASEFVKHGQNIREEYNHLNDLCWVKASAAFRIKAMAQPAIFQFPQFASFEAQARRNLANSLMQDWQTLGYLEPASSNVPGLDLVMNQG